MIICPHCGAENSRGVIFCIRCKTNVHYRKSATVKSERTITPEETHLVERIENAQATIGICIFFLVATFLLITFRFIGLLNEPDGGFVIMGWFVAAFKWGFLILIPFFGISRGLAVKRSAEDDLEKLRDAQANAEAHGIGQHSRIP